MLVWCGLSDKLVGELANASSYGLAGWENEIIREDAALVAWAWGVERNTDQQDAQTSLARAAYAVGLALDAVTVDGSAVRTEPI